MKKSPAKISLLLGFLLLLLMITSGCLTENNNATTKERADDTTSSEGRAATPPVTVETINNGDKHTTNDTPLTIFSVPPISVEDIVSIVPLGNLNPPSHTFPTDHIYFFISRQEGTNRTQEVTLYSPGDLAVTRVNAIEQLQAGIMDYSVHLKTGDHLRIRFGHVTSLAEDIFGDATSFQTWELTEEYTTGGETYRWWTKEYNISLEAGQVIGTAGGNPNQWALDLFLYDLSQTQRNIANPERWMKSWYLHAVDPLDYYEPGPVLQNLLQLVDRETPEGEEPTAASVLQDIPGTAQGCWFLEGINETYPEDPHLALVYDNLRPHLAVISTGNSVLNLPTGTYEFLPNEDELLNRAFEGIVPDGNIYGFNVDGFNGTIIISMPDHETLWMEALSGVSIEPRQWTFSANKTIFKR